MEVHRSSERQDNHVSAVNVFCLGSSHSDAAAPPKAVKRLEKNWQLVPEMAATIKTSFEES